jgi:hypothetical protein
MACSELLRRGYQLSQAIEHVGYTMYTARYPKSNRITSSHQAGIQVVIRLKQVFCPPPLCSTTFDPPIEQVLASFTTAGFQGEQLLDQRILGAFTARAENAEAAVVFSVARTFDTEAGIAISNCLMMVQAPRM